MDESGRKGWLAGWLVGSLSPFPSNCSGGFFFFLGVSASKTGLAAV